MNCIDYRRILLATNDETGPMQAHRIACVRCAALYDEHLATEAQLRAAFEVPVPPGLEQRLLTTTAAGGVMPRRRALILAAAALGAVAVGAEWWQRERADPLALACIQWVIKEETKSIMMGAMPREEAIRVLAPIVPLERIERLGQVRHIAPCPFEGGTAYHVVMTVREEKITLLVIPDRRLATLAHAAHEELIASVTTAGTGSIGVIGSSRAAVAGVLAQLAG